MLFLGIDVGSSSVKVSLMNADSGKVIGSAVSPESEMDIISVEPGFAEQNPDLWWQCVREAVLKSIAGLNCATEIAGIGIAYQMHGLVAIDDALKVVRPSIIWCDSRATDTGRRAESAPGKAFCMKHLLNLPANFTLSKLAWMKVNEPELYSRTRFAILPGDYISMRMTGEVSTTFTGISEWIAWDYKEHRLSNEIFDAFGLDSGVMPPARPSFGNHGILSSEAAEELRLPPGIPVLYKAGDQPNTAFSLNVLKPGEAAITAGTSGVIYLVAAGISDSGSEGINTFLHVNSDENCQMLGRLFCLNGAGILYSWLKRLTSPERGFEEMNNKAAGVPAGSDGLLLYPFGNGAERILKNQNVGASITGLNFNLHTSSTLFRAAMESIAFSFRLGLDQMKTGEDSLTLIRAGMANMFLSPLFCQIVSDVLKVPLEIYNTDGSLGAARGAAIGSGHYTFDTAFNNHLVLATYTPDPKNSGIYDLIFAGWKAGLNISNSQTTP
jgi:xylulokinase